MMCPVPGSTVGRHVAAEAQPPAWSLMNHQPQCIPCFLRRVLRMANEVTTDDWLRRKIVGEAMGDLVHVDDASTPAEVMHGIFKTTAKTLGSGDPFAKEKKRWHEEVLANAETLRSRLADADDPFLEALKMSAAANEIDDELLDGLALKSLLERFDEVKFAPENLDDFRAAVASAQSLFFAHDAAGEIFFDRLLIEQILAAAKPDCQAVSVIRSHPTIADATQEDADAVGLGEVARVIDPGLDCLGLPVSECSNELREAFRGAELIVCKGQAVYQSLEGEGRTPDGDEKDVWFLFRVKCPVMAEHLAVPIGDLILEPN